MTRINCIPPSQLTRQHLVAEYRELPRIFALSRKWHERGGVTGDLPETYRMGKGHVMFFYDKLRYCYGRQGMLYDECRQRGFRVRYKPTPELLEWAPAHLRKDYTPTREAMIANEARIAERKGVW